jgi:hypothetical protein
LTQHEAADQDFVSRWSSLAHDATEDHLQDSSNDGRLRDLDLSGPVGYADSSVRAWRFRITTVMRHRLAND